MVKSTIAERVAVDSAPLIVKEKLCTGRFALRPLRSRAQGIESKGAATDPNDFFGPLALRDAAGSREF